MLRSHRHLASHDPRAGVALIVVLGLVTALMTLAVAFSLSMRMGNLGARRFADRTRARHFERAGLVQCMAQINDMIEGRQNVYLWFEENSTSSFHHAFASVGANGVGAEVLVGAWSNFVPAVLWHDATNVSPTWMEIRGEDRDTGDIVSTNGRVAFVALNASGLLDAHILGATNSFMALDRSDVEWARLDDFAEDTNAVYVTTFADDLELHKRYSSLPEMSAMNSGLSGAPVAELYHYSYDPDPHSIPTNHADIGNFDIVLTNKFNINGITNYLVSDYGGDDFKSNYVLRVADLLGNLDSTQRVELAWSIVNLLDEDNVPQSDSSIPWREDYGSEAVPSINEIVLQQTSTEPRNAYGFSVETWFPFSRWTLPDDSYMLHVMVFTNCVTGVDPMALTNEQHEAWSFSSELPAMQAEDASAWFVAETQAGSDQEITFPVKVRSLPDSDVETLYLPLGVTTYTNYISAAEKMIVTVTNRVWMLARVLDGTNIVDEAMGYSKSVVPVDGKNTDGALLMFDEVGGYEVNDPRFNGHLGRWSYREEGEGTLWTTNAVYAQDLRGQGLPIVHLDRALEHVWEIGQAVHPRGPWNTIDLMDADGEASLLDRLMLHDPLEEPWEYGRVHLSTPFTNVLTALLAGQNLIFPSPERDESVTIEGAGARALAGTIIDLAPADLDRYYSFVSLFAAGGDALRDAIEAAVPSNATYRVDYLREQVIGQLVEKVTFRQNLYLVFVRSQALGGNSKSVVAETRRLYVVYRDAYSGRYFIKYVYPY